MQICDAKKNNFVLTLRFLDYSNCNKFKLGETVFELAQVLKLNLRVKSKPRRADYSGIVT